MIVVRWAISMGISSGVTLGLFFFMSVLIATGETLSCLLYTSDAADE